MMPSAPRSSCTMPATASVWLADLRHATPGPHSHVQALACLSESERARHARFIRPQRQLEFLAGRLLLRLALAHDFQIAAARVTLTEQPGHAPQLQVAENLDDVPFFSLSHSGGFVACCLSCTAPVGLDIETDQPKRDVATLSKAAFSTTEQTWWQQQPVDGQRAAFYRLWTSKEAQFKLNSMQQAIPATRSTRSSTALSTMIDEHGEFICGDSHFYYPTPDAAIHMAVCSTQALSSLTCLPAMSFNPIPATHKSGIDAFFFSSNNTQI